MKKIRNYMLSILWLVLWAIFSLPSFAQQSATQCLCNIQQRLEALGNPAEFDYQKLREIMRQFDYGELTKATADPAKAKAFKRVITSLSEFCDLAGGNLSAKGMKGYTRFSGGVIRGNGTDFVSDLKKVFGDSNFDGPGFNKVMEQLDGTGTWRNQTDWVSPAGLIYSTAPDLSQGHRISHVFNHTIPDPVKTPHSIFSVARKDVLDLVDEGWGKPNKYHPLKPDGKPDERVWIVDMGRPVGTVGEKHLKIVVGAVGSSEITTAFPFIP